MNKKNKCKKKYYIKTKNSKKKTKTILYKNENSKEMKRCTKDKEINYFLKKLNKIFKKQR